MRTESAADTARTASPDPTPDPRPTTERRLRADARRHQRITASPGRGSVDFRADWERFLTTLSAEEASGLRAELAHCHGRSRTDSTADAVLAAVVRRASVDHRAARVALQRIMPGLIVVAGRRGRSTGVAPAEILHELAANAWICIRTYPIERRPVRVAANLVRDAEYLTFAQQARLRRHDGPGSAEIDAARDHVSTEAASPGLEVLDMLATAADAGVDRTGLQMLGQLVLTERSVREVAEAFAVSTRTILNRRRSVEATLIELVGTAA